jgi:hypothetical protein
MSPGSRTVDSDLEDEQNDEELMDSVMVDWLS